MSTLVVTGADGFIGAQLCARLAAHGHQVRGTVRGLVQPSATPNIEVHAVGALEESPAWWSVLPGSDCVVHLAGRAHVVNETSTNADDAFRRVNVEATTALFRASQQAGVRRFVFVSSIGVLGTYSGDSTFDEHSLPHPTEAYALSKWAAERELTALAQSSQTQLVVVRPTLVCGVGAKGNFERLVRLVKRGLPLPLASVTGRRNFVGIHNLCNLLESCSQHPAAAGQTFLASDPETYTTPELICAIGAALGVKPRLLSCPPAILRAMGAAVGRRSEIDRLMGSLLVDSSLARTILGWRSTRSMDQELRDMALAVRDA